MPIVFTPWRYAYIKEGNVGSCIFCNAWSYEGDPGDVLLVSRERAVMTMLNRYPYTNGHLMIAPRRHTTELTDLSQETWTEMMARAVECTTALTAIYHPEGFNIGINVGRAAGAGVADHIHLHVVPRWNGDNNFMRVLADTRMIPEALDETYRKIVEALHDEP